MSNVSNSYTASPQKKKKKAGGRVACLDPKKSWDLAEKIHDLNDKVTDCMVAERALYPAGTFRWACFSY